MTIQLSEDRQRFVQALLKKGRFASENEVVEEALRILEQQDAKHDEEKKRIEALVLEGIHSGPLTPLDSEAWDEIEREGQRIMASRKKR